MVVFVSIVNSNPSEIFIPADVSVALYEFGETKKKKLDRRYFADGTRAKIFFCERMGYTFYKKF